MIGSTLKALGVMVAILLVLMLVLTDTGDESEAIQDGAEFYAVSFADNQGVCTFDTATSNGNIRSYRIDGRYSIESIDNHLIAPYHARGATHKVNMKTDEMGLLYLTVYPVSQIE